MSDIKFIINRDKKTVVCVLTGCKYVAIDRVDKYVARQDLCIMVNKKSCLINDSFVGKAKCSSEDVFDEKFGMQLALVRAKQKRAKAVNDVINNVIRKINESAKILEKYAIHKVPSEQELLI